ncbi:hypothetical protein E2C01_003175 [Portunus trituberculatus]|uniref:Uncharacterized protein n=1 Tax=Portunus trituberculatus TaxID=210409 RepID=A0A5B7CLW7_PORTR|nr:hypothetical protein [Portunus trituberculatus]
MTNSHGLLNLARGRRCLRCVRRRVGLISYHHWDLPGFALLPLPRLSTIRASSLPLQSAKISEVTQHSHTHTTSIRQLPGLPLLTCTLQHCHHSMLYSMLYFLLFDLNPRSTSHFRHIPSCMTEIKSLPPSPGWLVGEGSSHGSQGGSCVGSILSK